jgi:crotonobetainyl-CoA:carnitine CoA-transferase CaiB-like acyl-CoA transferase
MTDTPRYPLEGITVLDLGQIYQGPYCGFLLATAGARVIKVESPQGDPTRKSGGSAMPFAMLNGNKESVCLDLKTPEGQADFLRLVDQADVVIENFVPGVMARLGLAPESLLARNPRLVYGSASGYGSSGPYRDMMAMDFTIQAMSGMLNATGEPDGPPIKTGPATVDFLGGAHLYGAVVTALLERERTGKGRICEVAMLDVAYFTLTSYIGAFTDDPGFLPRTGNRHAGLSLAPYNLYPAQDGYLAILCIKDVHWQGVARAMGRDDLATDARFATHAQRAQDMAFIDELVGTWTLTRTRAELADAAREHGFPASPVRSLGEVMRDGHLHARGALVELDHPQLGPVTLPANPLRFAGLPPMPLRPSPDLGQDNAQLGVRMPDRRG